MQKMQDKATFEGAKQYLQSFFRNPQLGHSEFNERRSLLSALLSGWAQKDAMRLFYDVLFWSIQTESEHPHCFWYVQLWQVNNFPIRVIRFAGEPKARFYPHNIPTLRQIKKYMLKNDLPNPLPTFWVK